VKIHYWIRTLTQKTALKEVFIITNANTKFVAGKKGGDEDSGLEDDGEGGEDMDEDLKNEGGSGDEGAGDDDLEGGGDDFEEEEGMY
jgi:hypothetical protein